MTDTKTFQATSFNLRSFGGALRVLPWEHGDTTIEVALTGSAERIAAVKLAVRNSTLTMEDPKARSGDGSGTSISVNGGSISIRASGNSSVSNIHVGRMQVSGAGSIGIDMRGDGITINGVKIDPDAYGASKGEEPLSAAVYVPVGTAVEIDDLYQDAEIGDTLGPLSVQSSRAAALAVGRVTATSLQLKGSGDVRIREVNGSLTCSVMGSSDATIAKGHVEALTISAMGSGDVRYGGTSNNATISIMGSGDVTVGKVKGRVSKSVMGSGDLRIG